MLVTKPFLDRDLWTKIQSMSTLEGQLGRSFAKQYLPLWPSVERFETAFLKILTESRRTVGLKLIISPATKRSS